MQWIYDYYKRWYYQDVDEETIRKYHIVKTYKRLLYQMFNEHEGLKLTHIEEPNIGVVVRDKTYIMEGFICAYDTINEKDFVLFVKMYENDLPIGEEKQKKFREDWILRKKHIIETYKQNNYQCDSINICHPRELFYPNLPTGCPRHITRNE